MPTRMVNTNSTFSPICIRLHGPNIIPYDILPVSELFVRRNRILHYGETVSFRSQKTNKYIKKILNTT